MRRLTLVFLRLSLGSAALLVFMACGGGGGNNGSPGSPIVSFVADPSTITAGQSTALTAQFSGLDAWIEPGFLEMKPNVPTSVNPHVTQTYKLVVDDKSGKPWDQSLTVTVLPSAKISHNLPKAPYITAGETYSAWVVDQPGSHFAWTVSGGTIASSLGFSSLSFIPPATGTVQLSCKVTSPAGQEANDSITFTIVPAPDATLVQNWASAPYANRNQSGYSLSFRSPDSATPSWETNGWLKWDSYTGKTFSFTPTGPGDSTITAEVTNLAGSKAKGVSVVKGVELPSITEFKVDKPVVTSGDTIRLSYTFYYGRGEINPGHIPIPNSGTGSLELTPAQGQTYTMVVTNLAGATADKSLSVKIVPPPILNGFVSSALYSDPREGIQLTARFTDGQAVLIPGGTAMQNGVPLTVNPGVPTRYKVTITNEAGTGVSAAQVVYPSGGIAESFASTYAIDGLGQAWAWGSNASGQLGDGSQTHRGIPALIKGLDRVRMIFGAAKVTDALPTSVTGHAYALCTDGRVWAWGENVQGQLGQSAPANSTIPLTVPGLDSVVQMASGSDHALALKSDGSVWAWGSNLAGQLGNGTHSPVTGPTQVLGLPKCVMVAAKDLDSLAMDENGSVWAWGGSGTSSPQILQFEGAWAIHDGGVASGLGRVVFTIFGSYPYFNNVGADLVSYTAAHTFIKSDGTVFRDSAPVAVSNVVRGGDKVFLRKDGTLVAMGRNDWGELGFGGSVAQTSPFVVPGLGPVDWATLGGACMAVRKTDGSLWGWGSMVNNPLLPVGSTQQVPLYHAAPTPAPVGAPLGLSQGAALMGFPRFPSGATGCLEWAWGGVSNYLQPASFQRMVASDGHGLALQLDGSIWAWGTCTSGQLGIGEVAWTSDGGEAVPALSGLLDIAVGAAHSLALKADGTVLATGRNIEGQLGILTTAQAWTFGPVPGLSAIKAVFAGGNRSYALKADGSLWAWGEDLGPLPVHAQQPPGTLTSLAVGSNHTLALTSDGSVWAWGRNMNGQLGTGNTLAVTAPVRVAGLPVIHKIYSRDETSAAIDISGNLWVWGSDGPQGQLGLGRIIWTPTVLPVTGFHAW